MKSILPKLLLFVFMLALFASCQRTSCPAYGGASYNALNKPTFLKDNGRK